MTETATVQDLLRRAGGAWNHIFIWQQFASEVAADRAVARAVAAGRAESPWCAGVGRFVTGVAQAEYQLLKANGATDKEGLHPADPPVVWELHGIGGNWQSLSEELRVMAGNVIDDKRAERVREMSSMLRDESPRLRQPWAIASAEAARARSLMVQIERDLTTNARGYSPVSDQAHRWADVLRTMIKILDDAMRP